MENALQHHSQNFLMNSGQACVAASRTFVHEDIVDDFIAQLKLRFEQLSNTMGHPEKPETLYGPLADGKQFERVMEFLEIGKKEASLLTGGVRKGSSGFYIEPTIFLNPADDARIYREEIFGPVLTIRTFKTEEEAIHLANDTDYGLSACVFTASVPRALRIAKKINAGMVNINTSQQAGLEAPMGGSKQSGLGREGGKMGLMSYLEPKTICIK
jgi:aldehyde dehydrogenase (NAD+)